MSVVGFGAPSVEAIGIIYLCSRCEALRIFIRRSFLLDVRSWPGAFVFAFLALFIGAVSHALWDHLVATSSIAGGWSEATHPLSSMWAGRIFLVFYFSCITVMVEEVVFKVLLLTVLPKTIGALRYAILSAALFSLAHVSQGGVKVITVFLFIGFPGALYFYVSRNLGAVVFFHAVFNFWSLSFIFFK